MLHILARSVELGLHRCLAAMLGCLSAVVLVLIASAAGLATLLFALPGIFDILRYVGVAYLIFLGIKAWRAEIAPIDLEGLPIPPRISPWSVFRTGFSIAISNPKLLLFAAAFLPQFIEPTQAKAPQFALLIATFAVIETGWYFVYALGGRSLSRYLTRPQIRRWFNYATGSIFIGFGLALLRTRNTA